jgi:hypothetical protein
MFRQVTSIMAYIKLDVWNFFWQTCEELTITTNLMNIKYSKSQEYKFENTFWI